MFFPLSSSHSDMWRYFLSSAYFCYFHSDSSVIFSAYLCYFSTVTGEGEGISSLVFIYVLFTVTGEGMFFAQADAPSHIFDYIWRTNQQKNLSVFERQINI